MERNEKCYCGSGKKYKNCCLQKDLFTSRSVEATRPVGIVKKDKIDDYIKKVNKGLPKYQQEANKEWAKGMKAILSPNGTIICNI